MSKRSPDASLEHTNKKASVDADPALQGEGNYTAARRHRRSLEKFVQSGAVAPAAHRAAPADAEQERQLLAAEKAGRSHARK